jgi:hypothetical protein
LAAASIGRRIAPIGPSTARRTAPVGPSTERKIEPIEHSIGPKTERIALSTEPTIHSTALPTGSTARTIGSTARTTASIARPTVLSIAPGAQSIAALIVRDKPSIGLSIAPAKPSTEPTAPWNAPAMRLIARRALLTALAEAFAVVPAAWPGPTWELILAHVHEMT